MEEKTLRNHKSQDFSEVIQSDPTWCLSWRSPKILMEMVTKKSPSQKKSQTRRIARFFRLVHLQPPEPTPSKAYFGHRKTTGFPGGAAGCPHLEVLAAGRSRAHGFPRAAWRSGPKGKLIQGWYFYQWPWFVCVVIYASTLVYCSHQNEWLLGFACLVVGPKVPTILSQMISFHGNLPF